MADPAAALSDFLLFVVGSVVDNPDDVRLDEIEDQKSTRFEVAVHEDDRGTIAGEVGDAIATVVDACAYKHRLRAELAWVDELDDDDDLDEDEDEPVGFDDEDED